MSLTEQSPSFNSSMTSSQLDACENSMETINAKHHVREMLKSKIFLGRYLERRLINKQIGYRDVVLVSPAEFELKKVLLEARQKLISVYPTNHWIGISDSETLGYASGISLLTEIDNEPFGPYWFQIRSVKFRDSEIIVILKCLRHITDSYLEVEPILTGGSEKSRSSVLNTPVAVIESHLKYVYSEAKVNIKDALTLNNMKDLVTFMFAFFIALFSGGTSFIKFLGNFILALLREISILVQNSTPMFLGVLDFLSKIFGGFYILMAMVFGPSYPRPQRARSITSGPQQNYDYRNSF